jgi:hypothetical protein
MTLSVLMAGAGLKWAARCCGRRRALLLGSIGFLVPLELRLAVVMLAAAAVAELAARTRRVRRRDDPGDGSVVLLSFVVLVAVSAGLSARGALELARGELDGPLQGELMAVLRRARRAGLSRALLQASGPARPLFVRIAGAQLSGAPLLSAVQQFIEEHRARRHAAQIEAVRKLPVRLAIPLTLLVLPGFILLTVAPAAVSAFSRLLGPLIP